MMEQALSGLKVLESCQFVSGPYCTKLLADFGAEVLKIEKPGAGDVARSKGPFLKDIPHPERSGLFLYLNTNKLGITLNLDSVPGVRAFKELVKQADILVEDNPPGTMKKLGLDYECLKDINPALVMTSITPFGQTGPYKDYKAHHLNVFHSSGQGYLLPTFLTDLDREPVKTAGFKGDYDCGVNAALATLGAIHARRLIGCGQYIDISKQDCLLTMQRVELGEYPNLGLVENRMTVYGRTLGRPTRCKDGYVSVEPAMEHMWNGLVKAMDNPEWAKEDWCRDAETRGKNLKKLWPRVQEWTLKHTKKEIETRAQAFGCPAAPINTAEDIANSEQFREREFFVDIDHPEAGSLTYPGAPCKFSKTPWKVARPAPLLGEHNEDIYCNRLGYGKQDLVKMREAGVI
ncbi:CaiB/BaiF CoA transferase family protein [Thermodesulfobacteriota bacterium]